MSYSPPSMTSSAPHKIESVSDAFNLAKERCRDLTYAALFSAIIDPINALKIVGTVLGVIVALILLIVALHKVRKQVKANRIAEAKAEAKPKRMSHKRK